MSPLAGASVAAGIVLILLGLAEIFLTVLHPGRDGPIAVAINRAIWRVTVRVVRRFPRTRREVIAVAGGVMIASTIFLWAFLAVAGFALLAWPSLDSSFRTPEGATSLVDALYWSATTFTTLGYGDVVPVTPGWKLVATAEALFGFATLGTAATYLLTVFQGVDHRDRMALRIYSETRRTWDGAAFVLRCLSHEGAERLEVRIVGWADQTRALHERLYRFEPLAFYVRVGSDKHDPERMLEAIGNAAIAARLVATAPGMQEIRNAADELDVAFTEFARAAVRHHGRRRALAALDRAEATEEDAAKIESVWADVERALGPQPTPWDAGPDAREILALAARVRIFLDELDGITCWRALRDVQARR